MTNLVSIVRDTWHEDEVSVSKDTNNEEKKLQGDNSRNYSQHIRVFLKWFTIKEEIPSRENWFFKLTIFLRIRKNASRLKFKFMFRDYDAEIEELAFLQYYA